MKKISWFKVLFFISLVFVSIAIYKADYFVVPVIYSTTNLILSIICLIIGMIFMCKNWKDVLSVSFDNKISLKSAIAANGLSVFTKYIPGKVMVIMGRALYTANEYQIPIKITSLASLKTQLISLLIGFIFGFPLIFFVPINSMYLFLGAVFTISTIIFLFSEKFKRIALYFPRKVNKNLDYPILKFREFIKVLPSFLLNWTLWIAGFYFLTQALTSYNIPFFVGLSFPLAATIAILALIAPGGLGVREGILVICLIGLGLDKSMAITVATASRLWFLIGEIFIFMLAFLAKRYSNQR